MPGRRHQPRGCDASPDRRRRQDRRRAGFRLPQRRLRGDPRQGGDPVHGRGRASRVAELGLPLWHVRKSDQRRRRPRDGLSRRRRADRPRLLPDQSAHQGLQRPRVRVRDRAVRRLYRERPRRALHRVRLLERPDDARVLQRARKRQGPRVPEARPSRGGDDPEHRAHPAHQRAPEPRAFPREPRDQLPREDDRDAHLGNRLLQRPQRFRYLDQRARRDDRAGPLRRRRLRQHPPQLHARRVRLRPLRR